jgi:hypothetical protein
MMHVNVVSVMASEFESLPVKGNFSSPNRPHQLWGLRSTGYRGSFMGVRRSGRDVGHSPAFNSEIMTGALTMSPWSHRCSLTFLLLLLHLTDKSSYRMISNINGFSLY